MATVSPYPIGNSVVGASGGSDVYISPERWELPDNPQDLLKRLRNLVAEAQEQKTEIETRWDEDQAFYDGKQWATVDRHHPRKDHWEDAEAVTLNLYRESINVILPQLLDGIPTFYVSALNPDLDGQTRDIQAYLQGLAFQENLTTDNELVYKDALARGWGSMKVWWDNTWLHTATAYGTDSRLGRPRVAYLNPYSVFPDPNAEKLEDCEFLALRYAYSPGLIKRLYPHADLRQMDIEDTGKRRRTDRSNKSTDSPRYQVWEVYHDFGERMTQFSNNEILWNGPSPAPYSRFPVVGFPVDEQAEDIYGRSLLACGGRDLFEAVNTTLSRIGVNLRLASNPGFIQYGGGTFVPDNSPGGLSQLNGGGPNAKIEPKPVAELPGQVMALLEFYIGQCQAWTGSTNVLMGEGEQGMRSAMAYQAASQAAQTRLKQILRSFNNGLSQVGQMLLEVVAHYGIKGTPAMSAHVVGSGGAERKTLDPDMLRMISQGDDGHVISEPYQFKVLVGPSEVPITQQAIQQMTMAFMAQGLPVDIAMKSVRYPFADSAIKEMQQRAADNLKAAQANQNAANLHMQAIHEQAGQPQGGQPQGPPPGPPGQGAPPQGTPPDQQAQAQDQAAQQAGPPQGP